MIKKQLKQQRLSALTKSPNRRDTKKQQGMNNDKKMEDIEEEMKAANPKELFSGISVETTLLFKNPDNDR